MDAVIVERLKRSNRPAMLALGGALLLALLAMIAFEPLVKGAVERRARDRGLEVLVDDVDLAWSGVWLNDVTVSAPLMPSMKAELQAVFVPLGDAAVRVRGGRVSLRGDQAQVSQELARLRGSSESSPAPRGPGRDYDVEGIDLVWSGLPSARDTQRAWGLGYRRSAGAESVRATLVRFVSSGAALEVRAGSFELARGEDGRSLSAAEAEAVSVRVDLGRFGLARPEGDEPSPSPSLAGDSSARLPLLLAALQQRVRAALAPGARLRVASVRAELRVQKDALNFGPSRLLVERGPESLAAQLDPPTSAQADSTPLALRATLPLGPGEPELELAGGPVSLAVLGVREGDFGLFDVRQATLEAQTKLTLIAGPRLRLRGSGSLQNVSLSRPALSPAPLRNLRLGWRGSAEAALDGSRFDVSDGELTVGELRLQGSGTLERGPQFIRVEVKGGVPLAACEKVLESVPSGFAPMLDGLRMSGTFAASFAMDADTRHLQRMKIKLDVQNACTITHVPEQLVPSRFKGPWTRTVRGADEQPMTIESGPGTPSWVPYEDISAHMETAVVVCEDGGFFRHGGFDYRAIEKSIGDNVRAGRFVRGASTISMQLAKNLYLGKEKTLSRKFEEAILTMLLEQQFEKREMMELYLNVIEFGPGLYGIGPAARHYFNVEPARLTLGQALYLGSILPSPDRQHFDANGFVSERWSKYLQKLMTIAHKIRRVSDEELAAGLEEQVQFRVPGEQPPEFSDELPPAPLEPLEPLVDEEPRAD